MKAGALKHILNKLEFKGVQVKFSLIFGLGIWFFGTLALFNEKYKSEFYIRLSEHVPHLSFLLHGTLFLLFALLSAVIWHHFEKNRRISTELRLSEARFTFLLNSIGDAVRIQEEDSGSILYENPVAVELLGTEDESWLEHVNPEDREGVRTLIRPPGKIAPSAALFRMMGPEGTLRHYLIRRTRSSEGDSEKKGMYSLFITDITRLKKSEEEIQNLTQTLINAQERERRRIARDLHDHIAQGLASVRLQLQHIQEMQNTPDSPEIRDSLKRTGDTVVSLLEDIRNISTGLHPPELDQLGLLLAVRQLADSFSEESGVQVDFQAAAVKDLRLPDTMEINIYRIIQEALNNIRKHAEASAVHLKMVRQGSRITIRIDDDGKGFEREVIQAKSLEDRHMGLRSMEERSRILGAELSLRSKAGAGTKIVLVVPYVKR